MKTSSDNQRDDSNHAYLNGEPARMVEVIESSLLLKNHRYQLEQLLGTGAFGAVYSGRDSILERPVAIKIPKLEKKDAVANFLNEMKSAAKLKHPHIISIYDSGVDQDGKPFAVYELVQGHTLLELSAEGKVDRVTAVRLIAEAADGIHYAHRQSLIHRDLKPSNIMVSHDGMALITDFGLAVNEATQRSHSGDVSGSPAYMSPEQVRGETRRLDGRTDIWSLGVVLYELLTGRRPFQGRNHEEVFEEILLREPKPPRQIDDTIPKPLEECIFKCLEKSIKDRYTTAGDLAQDLRNWLAANSGSVSLISNFLNPSLDAMAVASTAVIKDSKVVTERAAKRTPSKKLVVLKVLSVMLLAAFGLGLLWKFQDGDIPSDGQPIASTGHTINETRSPLNSAENALTLTASPQRDNKIPLLEVNPFETPESLNQANWHPLLLAEPTALSWPILSNRSHKIFDAQTQILSATTNEIGLFALGEAGSKNYRIRIHFSQTPWVGGAGVFIGYHAVERPANPKHAYQCQSIEFLPSASGVNKPYLARSMLSFNDNGGLVQRDTVYRSPVESVHGENERLEIIIVNGELQAVLSNHHLIGGLTSPECDEDFRIINPAHDDMTTGTFGAQVQNGAFLISDATWLSTKENEK